MQPLVWIHSSKPQPTCYIPQPADPFTTRHPGLEHIELADKGSPGAGRAEATMADNCNPGEASCGYGRTGLVLILGGSGHRKGDGQAKPLRLCDYRDSQRLGSRANHLTPWRHRGDTACLCL